MPPKRATPGTSRKRGPSADAGPKSHKRGQHATTDPSAQQTSLSWGDDDDQPHNRVPLNTREASPSKGALRSASRGRRRAEPEPEHELFYEPALSPRGIEDEAEFQAAMRRLDEEDERNARQRAAVLESWKRSRATTGSGLEEEVDEWVGGSEYDSERSDGTVSDIETDEILEKYSLAQPPVTEYEPPTRAFQGEAGVSFVPINTRVPQVGSTRTTTASTTAGRAPVAGSKAGGRVRGASTQSSGQVLGGNLPGLSFTAGPKNKEVTVQKIFASTDAYQGFDKDEVLAHNMSILVGGVVEHAHKYCRSSIKSSKRRSFFDNILERDNAHLIRYLGCLAIAGDQGEQSWVELLTEGSTREALAVGVLGRALKEHVFGELWFGGRKAQVDMMEKLEKDETFENLDGFSRTEKRAEVVKTFVAQKEGKANKPDFERACCETALRLDAMLQPFLDPDHPGDEQERQDGLYDIVRFAGRLSRIMRQAPDVVYYWPPTFKDEEFEPSRMECLNLKDILLASPYEKKEVHGIERAVVRENHKGDNTEAIVKVVCFPGLVAYRQYGGETGRREIEAEENRGTIREPDDVRCARARRVHNGVEAVPDPDAHGFRSRVVCKSVVYLAWSRQRLLTREAGTSAHIDAVREGPAGMKKYEDDYKNFQELYNIARSRWGEDMDIE